MTHFRRIAELANRIADLQDELNEMQKAWENSDSDPCNAATSDPSDQFVIGEEIDSLVRELEDELHSRS